MHHFAYHLQQRMDNLAKLPPMPEVAQRILSLYDDDLAGSREIADITKQDPALASQILRYATSPMFGTQDQVQSIHEAVIRLGFQRVMNLALALSMGKSFDLPARGPIGLKAFWHHALYSAFMMQSLADKVKAKERPSPGMAYLVGLLHNLGFLVLGHLFKTEFEILSRTIEQNPERPITQIEQELFGMDHARLGQRLLKDWQMPDLLIDAVAAHHDEGYKGKNYSYANLMLLVDRALRHLNVGEGESIEYPPKVLKRLNLTPEHFDVALTDLGDKRKELAALAESMVSGD